MALRERRRHQRDPERLVECKRGASPATGNKPRRQIEARLIDHRTGDRNARRRSDGLRARSTGVGWQDRDPDVARYLLALCPCGGCPSPIQSGEVAATLNEVCSNKDCPKAIRVDRRAEFVSRDIDPWAYSHVSSWTSHGPASRLIWPNSPLIWRIGVASFSTALATCCAKPTSLPPLRQKADRSAAHALTGSRGH